MHGYKKLLFLAFIVFFVYPLKGQNTDSPYSRYGYGILNNQSIGAAKSMGGISYGVRGISSNPGNPASYSAVDSLTFIFDIGISYVKSSLTEGAIKQNDNNGGLDYLSMQLPLSRKVGMSLGLLPFSSVGYSFGTADTENGLLSTKTFSGSGGFSQIYAGVAYEPMRNLSVGANVSYLFGNTTYSRSLSVNVPSSNTEIWYHKMTLNMLKFDLGVQYTLPLNKKDNLIIGAVFSPERKTSGKIFRIHNEFGSSSSSPVLADTATFTGSGAYTDLPNTFGAGLTWNRNSNLLVGADVTYQTWSKSRYSNNTDDNLSTTDRFNDRFRINAGFEYAIDPRDRSFIKRVKFRGGFNYSNSYINVKDSKGNISGYNEYGATLGFGIPVKDMYSGRSSYINIGFEYKKIAPEKSYLIKEQYFGVSLGVNLNELWFLKNKFR
ncbi:MAG: hypothetical protein RL662_1901 [Bacteroidota bacterium]|jgi:hypothetical protein